MPWEARLSEWAQRRRLSRQLRPTEGQQLVMDDLTPSDHSSGDYSNILNEVEDVSLLEVHWNGLSFRESIDHQLNSKDESYVGDHGAVYVDESEDYRRDFHDPFDRDDERASEENLRKDETVGQDFGEDVGQKLPPQVEFSEGDLGHGKSVTVDAQLPRGATRIKLRDATREAKRARRKEEQRKRRKAQAKVREPQVSDQSRREVLKAEERYTSRQKLPVSEHELPDDQVERPPLRSASKWTQLGKTQLSLWQSYSPSSKSLLFGSWFASLERLVEVYVNSEEDRKAFFAKTQEHEQLSSLSPAELDAWWFQLNRVDHFITEYHFQHRLAFLKKYAQQTASSAVVQPDLPEAVRDKNDHHQSQEDTGEFADHDLDVVDPLITSADIDSERENVHTELPAVIVIDPTSQPEEHVEYVPERKNRQSIRQSSLEEDIILRPVRRRRKRRKG